VDGIDGYGSQTFFYRCSHPCTECFHIERACFCITCTCVSGFDNHALIMSCARDLEPRPVCRNVRVIWLCSELPRTVWKNIAMTHH
jgi:hypothetical protein